MGIRKGNKVFTPDGVGIVTDILDADSAIFRTTIVVTYGKAMTVYHLQDEVHLLKIQPYTRMEMLKVWATKS